MPSLGERLRQGREAKGLTLQAVAGSTKIRENILVALESDNRAGLPAPVFVRGFLRTLGRCLSLNTDELLALYAEVTAPAEAPKPEVQLNRVHGNGHGPTAGPAAPAEKPKLILARGRTSAHSNGNGHDPKPADVARIEALRSRIYGSNGSGRHNGGGDANGQGNGHGPAESDETPTVEVASVHVNGSGNGHVNAKAHSGIVPAPVTAAKSGRVASGAAPVRPTLTPGRPSWLSANVLMTGLIALLLVAGMAWGGDQVLKSIAQSQPVKALQQAQPTIAAMMMEATAIPTPLVNPEPTSAAPTAAPTVLPSVFTSPPPPPAAPANKLEVLLEVKARSWLRVEADGAEVFQGFLEADTNRTFTAANRVTLRAGNGGGVTVSVNGKSQGILGADGAVVDRQWVLVDSGAAAAATPVWTNPPFPPTPTPQK